MKFGSVPVEEALGAILAHSESVPGKRFRKGIMLEREHIDVLRESGIAEVEVARLDKDDVHENPAAEILARALHEGSEGIRQTAPFTGRVNLIAESPGVVVVEKSKVNSSNLTDPMITIATVPCYHQIHGGGMVATVKIISYAVGKSAILDAADKARGAIRLARPVVSTASLIVTDIPGGPGLKGVAAIEARVAGLGVTLVETVRIAHEKNILAGEMQKAKGEVILILTGSATSDIADTAPEALRMAGGTVERFGMPVDPGNLLFLGSLEGKSVIGLPGSARSPVLHGADWILSRVACGIQTESGDIAALGVGGLLKEIPTRPQPRRGK
ncbi:MAG: molybdopterin-binding protein [Roseovarius sp.]|nr:molybdopterin-binding protein [Roseovarius sp.]MCY4208127.1 molybdopterin-binding protein [Roseovarius sp.]MCY4292136.1 molybdopterin-binding protein [Roseovarius sp.]